MPGSVVLQTMTNALPRESAVAGSPGFKDMDSVEKAHLEKITTAGTDQLLDIDPSLDRRITRKLDKHIVPWLFGLWLLAFIDRSNIGNARIDGLVTDLKLDGNKFNIVGRGDWEAYTQRMPWADDQTARH